MRRCRFDGRASSSLTVAQNTDDPSDSPSEESIVHERFPSSDAYVPVPVPSLFVHSAAAIRPDACALTAESAGFDADEAADATSTPRPVKSTDDSELDSSE